jgi:hypothetical protein
MARLWKVFHGEPFMVNPGLGILGINPRKKEGRSSSMAKKFGARHMAWVRSFRKKGHGHRRKAHNPRRYHARARRHNPVRRRHSYMRNPSIMGFELPALNSVLYVGVGLLGTPAAESFITGFLPTSITASTIGKYAVKLGTVLGLTFIVKAIMGREQAKMVGIGGGGYILLSAFKDFAPASIKAYVPGMGAYPVAGPTLSAYGGANKLAAYGSSTGRNYTGMGAPNFGAQNGPFTSGGTNIVASRFRRFQ